VIVLVFCIFDYTLRRKIRLIEGNAKCRHLKNGPVKGYSIQNTYSPREGEEGGRVEPERRLEKQQFTELDRKYQHE
jgi:hypothetical protein